MDTFTENTLLGPIGISEENGRIVSVRFGSDCSEDTVMTETLRKAFSELDEYLIGKRRSFDLEYAPEGTEFQKEIWSALLRIPYGTTQSYNDLALSAGHPNAYRAAGNANGKNPIPIFIPCHRVIHADGSLGGYSSGSDIKRMLLRIEGIIL